MSRTTQRLESSGRDGRTMSSAVCTVVRLLSTALLLGSGPSYLSDAMPHPAPFEVSGSGTAPPDPSDVWGSGELQGEPDPWIGTASRDGDRDQLLPLSERSPVWTEAPGDEEPEIGSGDGSASAQTPTIVSPEEVASYIFNLLQQNEERVIKVKKWVPEPSEEAGMESDMEDKGMYVRNKVGIPDDH